MKDFITVIVPVYNVENELERCVQSICQQTYKKLEIILVDDGSTDNSGYLCDKFAQKDKRIKVIHQKNSGISAARKKAFEMSTGGVIAFVDSDDYIELDMFETMVKNMNLTNADIVICDYRSIINENTDDRYFFEYDKLMEKDEALKYLANDEIRSFMWNKLYKKKCLNRSDFYVGKLMEDYLCMADIFNRCELISYVHNIFYNYVRRDNSTMGSKNIMYFYFNACKSRMEWYKKEAPQYIERCLNRCVRTALTCLENNDINKEYKIIIRKFLKEHLKEILKNRYLNLHKKIKVISYTLINY